MKVLRRVTLMLSVFALLASFVHPASARRAIALSGNAPFPSDAACMGYETTSGNQGIMLSKNNTNCSSFFIGPIWMIPLQVDTSGTKSVALTVKQTAAGQIQCALMETNRSGSVVQLINYDAFSVGSYVTATKSITIATNDSLTVMCAYNWKDANISGARVLAAEF